MRELAHSSFSRKSIVWLTGSPLDDFADAWFQHLIDRGDTIGTLNGYLGCVAHFSRWIVLRRLALIELDEEVVDCFLEHLPTCHCARHCQRVRHTVQSALKHLLALLRREGLIAPRRSVDPAHVLAELERFGRYLEEIRGLAVTTRYQLRIRSFLMWCFGTKPVDLRSVSRNTIDRFLRSCTGH